VNEPLNEEIAGKLDEAAVLLSDHGANPFRVRAYRRAAQTLRRLQDPVSAIFLIGGTMGTASYVLAGTSESERRSFSSSCHGTGRAMSRHQTLRQWRGRQVVDALAARGILVRSWSSRGVAEEAPGAYKDVGAVVDAAHGAGLSRKVARLVPLICVKG
jgi:tRNA-splicing ligase RtcB